MTDTSKAKTVTGVRAKLATHKAQSDGREVARTLPQSGVAVTIPGFLNHGSWMKAQRQAGGDIATAQAAFVAETVRFEGEKLTLADLRELVDAKDMLFLISEIFGDQDAETDASGNATA